MWLDSRWLVAFERAASRHFCRLLDSFVNSQLSLGGVREIAVADVDGRISQDAPYFLEMNYVAARFGVPYGAFRDVLRLQTSARHDIPVE